MTAVYPLAAAPVEKAPAVPHYAIQRVYLKGMSLEIPGAPEIYSVARELSLNFQVQRSSTTVAQDLHEVTLTATVEAKDAKTGKTEFLLEVTQAGLFEMRGIPAEHVEGLIDVRSPTILHAYLRVAISDTLQRASLPLFIIPEFDYNLIQQQTKAALAAQAAPAAGHSLH